MQEKLWTLTGRVDQKTRSLFPFSHVSSFEISWWMAAVINPEGRGFNSHPGQSFPLSLCGPNSISKANAYMVYGLKTSTSHYILLVYLMENWVEFTKGYVSGSNCEFVNFYCLLPSNQIIAKIGCNYKEWYIETTVREGTKCHSFDNNPVVLLIFNRIAPVWLF